MLKNKSRISSNCSFQISRVSNQNWLHLCHDRLWFLGDVFMFGHPASTTTWTVSELTGTIPLVTVSSSATAPAPPLCFSWYSLVRWRAMFVLNYEILGMLSLRVFQVSFAHALTRGASLVAASPRPNAAALGGRVRPRRGGRAAAEVRRLRGGDGQIRWPPPQSCRHGNCVGEEIRW